MKKRTKTLVAIIPFILVGAAIGTYALITSNSKSSIIKEHQPMAPFEINQSVTPEQRENYNEGEGRTPLQILYDQYDVFPILRQEDFYNYIRFSYDHPIINEEMKAAIIRFVIRNMNISDGKVEWGYETKSDQDVIFTFKWITYQKTYSHSYEFKLKNKGV